MMTNFSQSILKLTVRYLELVKRAKIGIHHQPTHRAMCFNYYPIFRFYELKPVAIVVFKMSMVLRIEIFFWKERKKKTPPFTNLHSGS